MEKIAVVVFTLDDNLVPVFTSMEGALFAWEVDVLAQDISKVYGGGVSDHWRSAKATIYETNELIEGEPTVAISYVDTTNQ